MARLLLLSLVVAFAGAFAPSTLAPRAAALTVVDGAATSGRRVRYFSIREWGKAQDPPMSVEEVVASKVADLNKVAMTQEELIDALTPF
ncbi:hypothetical protein JL720_12533 [Aureococcus anophagefferens]|nr:hypothetical protein JL720_12533 [Aureococcus anophagefferens]